MIYYLSKIIHRINYIMWVVLAKHGQYIFNQFTSGILYFFPVPHAGLFSVKIRKKFLAINKTNLSMKRISDNQINTFLIDISRIRWLFLFCYGRLSSAQLDRWQAPKQRRSIDQHPVEQTAYLTEIKDNGYKSVYHKFLAGICTSKEQVLDKGIRQKNNKKSELVHCLQCLLSGATEP